MNEDWKCCIYLTKSENIQYVLVITYWKGCVRKGCPTIQEIHPPHIPGTMEEDPAEPGQSNIAGVGYDLKGGRNG